MKSVTSNCRKLRDQTTLTDFILYGSSRLGTYAANTILDSSVTTFTNNPAKLRFELTDHLGNVRAVISDRLTASGTVNDITNDAEVLSYNNYYPFGMLQPGRNFAANTYRFGFGGQEKEDEVSGSTGTHYSAEFWMYDTRIGRRWNLDPKPDMSVSQYACFANNPIWFSDVLGDTATVRYGGFLGFGRKEARYVNDQWINSKDRQNIDINTVKSKSSKELMSDYSTLNQLYAFDPLTDIINNAQNNVNLLSTNGPNQVGPEADIKKYFTELYGGNAHPDIDVYLPNLVGVKSDIKMAHELGHTWDVLRSGRSLNNFKDNGSGASNSEVNAMYWENVLRSLHKMPLRIEYAPGVAGTPRANAQYKALPPYTIFLGKILYLKTTLTNLDGTQKYDFYK